jgi:threonine aldolase
VTAVAHPVVDLRSDTVTRPTPGMREAMASAEVGDDVYGEDPTVTALEQHVAALLGHEAGLFTPTGSLANMLGVRLLVEPGQELLCDALAHVVRAELGGHAVHGQVTTRTFSGPRGLLDADAALAMAAPDAGPYLVSTAAIAVENTHNFGGGTVQPLGAIREVRAATAAVGVAMHLDGARLWNAHVATGTPLADYGRIADVLAVCLSKGLGAPIGSLMVGSADAVADARVRRKRMGGGMRQVGVLAAAGLVALTEMVDRLPEDHARARRLTAGLAELPAVDLDPASVQTNIVVFRLRPEHFPSRDGLAPAGRFVAGMRERGVLCGAFGGFEVRMVTHYEIDDGAIEKALVAARATLAS